MTPKTKTKSLQRVPSVDTDPSLFLMKQMRLCNQCLVGQHKHLKNSVFKSTI